MSGLFVALALIASGFPFAFTANASAEPVPLDALLEYADAHAPAVRIALAREGYADAEREGASPRVPENPALEVGAGPRFNGAQNRDYDFYASLSQTVDVSGGRARRLLVATRMAERLAAETREARLQARVDTARAYHRAQVADARRALAGRVVALHDALRTLARTRLARGEGTRIEAQLAEVELLRAEDTRLAAEQVYMDARLELAAVTGYPSATPPEVTPLHGTDVVVPALEDVLTALAEHPSSVARRASLAEADARTEAADRAGRPSPTFGVQVSREGSAGSPANYIVLGQLGIALPFARRNQGDRARARVDAEVARVAAEGTLTLTEAELRRAHAALTQADARMTRFADPGVRALDESLALLRRAFEAGELDLVTLLTAEDRFVETQSASLDAAAARFDAAVTFEALAAGAAAEGGAR